MTDNDVYRKLLLEERERVVAALDYLHLENAGSMRDEADEATIADNLAETASVTLDREIDYSLEEASNHVLAAIDEALVRLDRETYGNCVTCGRPIGDDRLRAIPYATQCIDCRRREERG
ncbi:MAG TPA: TraR/DksA C4-type zinc finger protein [Gaiellaceae bacterium]|nr:TraR/DksA C4-type zinc finger protein [Gaiellaceae bacterium]